MNTIHEILNHKTCILIAILMIGFSYSSKAQYADSTVYLHEVEVKAEKIPERLSFKTTQITKEKIEQYLSASLGELLTLQTPIFIKSYGAGGTATPSFRGTGASHTQVYWNGINLNSPMLGQVDLSLFPVAFTDEITINYGGSSLLQGTGGLGGGIQMNSKVVFEDHTKVMASQTFNTLENSITNASVTLGNKKLQSTTKLFYKNAQNRFEFENPLQPNSPTWVNDHSAQIQYGAMQELAWKVNDQHQIQLNAWYQKSDRELTPSMDSKEGDSWQGDDSFKLLGNWKFTNDRLKTEFITALLIDDLWYKRQLNNDENPKMTASDSRSVQWQNHFKTTYQLTPKILIRGGVDDYYDQIHSNAYHSVNDTTNKEVAQHTLDLYAGVDWVIFDQTTLSFLARQEWIDGDIKPFLPSLGIDTDINPYDKVVVGVRANVSKNFHAPSLNDRYWYPVGNPDLLPEEGWTYEATFKLRSNTTSNWQWKYELTGFNSLIDNWIVWKPAVSNLWRPENLKRVHSRGLEQIAEVSYKKNDWNFHLYTSISMVHSENTEANDELDQSVGKQLIYTPVGSFQGYFQVNYKKWYSIVEQQIYGERLTQTDGSEYLPPYYLTNLTIGKQIKWMNSTWDVKARVENIFNYHYQSIARKPMPGRVFQCTLTYNF
ncbi:TonB-dependent receptor plug domain-containing protein [Flammeovirga pacifica]|nr:TonB-dependent receptor [Flammeovirga pacifica]